MAFFRRHKISAALLLLAHSTISCASGGTIAPDGGGVVPDGGVVLDAGLGDAGLDVAATDYEACSDFTVWAIACEGHPEGVPEGTDFCTSYLDTGSHYLAWLSCLTEAASCIEGVVVNGDEDACAEFFPEPQCGNSIDERFEACDDGNQARFDGCDPECRQTGPVIAALSTTPTGVGPEGGLVDICYDGRGALGCSLFLTSSEDEVVFQNLSTRGCIEPFFVAEQTVVRLACFSLDGDVGTVAIREILIPTTPTVVSLDAFPPHLPPAGGPTTVSFAAYATEGCTLSSGSVVHALDESGAVDVVVNSSTTFEFACNVLGEVEERTIDVTVGPVVFDFVPSLSFPFEGGDGDGDGDSEEDAGSLDAGTDDGIREGNSAVRWRSGYTTGCSLTIIDASGPRVIEAGPDGYVSEPVSVGTSVEFSLSCTDGLSVVTEALVVDAPPPAQ